MSDWDTRVTAALAGGILLGTIVAATAGPVASLFFGRGLAYECTPSGSFCVCKGVFDCLQMGQDGRCKGKEIFCQIPPGPKCWCY